MNLNLERMNKIEALNADTSHFVNSNDICTPMGCVKEMVDVIPLSFWRKKNIKILDSCCGNGNFHAYINTKTPLKNLYFNDINQARIENVRLLFGEDANVSMYDFLSLKQSPPEYDLIVSNPPYAKFNGVKRAAKNHNMARDFISQSIRLLKPNGYLLFIVPNNWMSFSDRNMLPRDLRAYQFHHISIHNAKKWFPKVGSSFTWFLWQKSKTNLPCVVENSYRIKNTTQVTLLKEGDCLPLFLSDNVEAIFKKTIFSDKRKYAVETSSDLHHHTKRNLLCEMKDKKHQYRLRHTSLRTAWSCRPHKYQKGWKVFIPLSHYYKPFIDDCGMTQSIAFVRCESKSMAKRVCHELTDTLYFFLADLTRYGNFNNVRVLQRFPYLSEVNLTLEEKDFIQRFYGEIPYGKDK